MELRSGRKLQNAGFSLEELTAINSDRSPLLRLPQEIKDRIYQLVLGGNLLHIWRDQIEFERNNIHSTKGAIIEQYFNHQICCSQFSEDDAHHHFENEDSNDFYVEDVELRHSFCRVSTNRYFAAATIRIDLSLLHVCRQIYDEARYILYSNNTFSFSTARNLRAFIHFLDQRGVDVNKAVRSLHVDLAHLDSNTSGWTQAFKAVTQHMTRLKTLYINVDPRPNFAPNSDTIEKERSMRPVMKALAMLGKALAKSAVIILSDRLRAGTPRITIRPIRRWPMDERRLWVQEIKLAIQDGQLFGH